MNRRNWVSFKSTVPDDSEWTPAGDISVPGGRTISTSIAAFLINRGFEVSSVEQHSFYGWAFDVRSDDCRAWCLLQDADPWLLIVEQRKGGLSWLRGSEPTARMETLLNTLGMLMSAESEYSSVCWYTRREYEAGHMGGAERPVS